MNVSENAANKCVGLHGVSVFCVYHLQIGCNLVFKDRSCKSLTSLEEGVLHFVQCASPY